MALVTAQQQTGFDDDGSLARPMRRTPSRREG
jgi:hypothetical protein